MNTLETERRRGPSTYTLTVNGIVAVILLAANQLSMLFASEHSIAALEKTVIQQDQAIQTLHTEIRIVAGIRQLRECEKEPVVKTSL